MSVLKLGVVLCVPRRLYNLAVVLPAELLLRFMDESLCLSRLISGRLIPVSFLALVRAVVVLSIRVKLWVMEMTQEKESVAGEVSRLW